MKFNVETVLNGAILTMLPDEIDDYTEKTLFIFDEDDDSGLDDAIKKIFSLMQMDFPNKNNKRNTICSVARIHGWNYECNEKDCKMCKGRKIINS